MLGFVLVRGFNFHASHVDARWAIALAPLTANAQVHGLLNFFTAQSIFAKLAAQCQSQCVGTAPREVLLITCDAITGAHGACIKLSTRAIVVAHLHRFGKALRGIATGARCSRLLCCRIVLNIPHAPIEYGF